jgi:hypothetical protein
VIVKPDTVVAWHRKGFRLFWTWKSRQRTGRPAVAADVRALIRQIARQNPLWGAPRIHGELLKLGMRVAGDRGKVHGPPGDTTVAAVAHLPRQSRPAEPNVVTPLVA